MWIWCPTLLKQASCTRCPSSRIVDGRPKLECLICDYLASKTYDETLKACHGWTYMEGVVDLWICICLWWNPKCIMQANIESTN